MHSSAVACPLPGRPILTAVSCPPAIHVPWLNEASKYSAVKLTGLGEIIQDTQMMQPQKILQNKTKWDHISLPDADIWLCFQQGRNLDFTRLAAVSTCTRCYTWCFGRGTYCREDTANEICFILLFLWFSGVCSHVCESDVMNGWLSADCTVTLWPVKQNLYQSGCCL